MITEEETKEILIRLKITKENDETLSCFKYDYLKDLTIEMINEYNNKRMK